MAAIQSIAAGDAQSAAAVTPLLESLGDVLGQFGRGVSAPTVSFTNISQFGSEPLDSWKAVLEQALNVKLELRASLDTNAITVHPLRPHMSPSAPTVLPNTSQDGQAVEAPEVNTPASDDTTISATSSKKVGGQGRTKDKAPRPKNAFIIYRKEWHPKIVARCPDKHNNDISVLIGRQWKDESDVVKNKYRSMADKEKRQHLIDHPGYQYQPRKPSEKKKRMTKNKLAKLRARSIDAGQDPMQEINGLLAAAAADNQATVDTFVAPHRQGMPLVTDEGNYNGFIANSEHEDLLFNQLAAWNTGRPVAQQDSAYASQMYVDGQTTTTAQSFALPMGYGIDSVFNSSERTQGPASDAAVATGNTNAFGGNREVDRQQTLFDDAAINDLFDLDAFDLEFN